MDGTKTQCAELERQLEQERERQSMRQEDGPAPAAAEAPAGAVQVASTREALGSDDSDELKSLREKGEKLGKELRQWQARAEEAEAREGEAKRELESVRESIDAEVSRCNDETNRRYAEDKEKLRAEQAEVQAEAERKSEKQKAEAQKTIDKLILSADETRQEMEHLKEELEDMRGERDGLSTEIEEIKGEGNRLRGELEGSQAKEKALNDKVAELSAQIEQLEAQAAEKEKKILSLEERIAKIKELIKNAKEEAKEEKNQLTLKNKLLETEKKELEDSNRRLQRKLNKGQAETRQHRPARLAGRADKSKPTEGVKDQGEGSSAADDGSVAGRNPSVRSDLMASEGTLINGDEDAGSSVPPAAAHAGEEGVDDNGPATLDRSQSHYGEVRPGSWSSQITDGRFSGSFNGRAPQSWPDSDEGAYSVDSASGGGFKTPVSKSPVQGEAEVSPLEAGPRDADVLAGAQVHGAPKDASDGPPSVPSSLGAASPLGASRGGGMRSVNSNGSSMMRMAADGVGGCPRCKYLELELEDIENRYSLQVAPLTVPGALLASFAVLCGGIFFLYLGWRWPSKVLATGEGMCGRKHPQAVCAPSCVVKNTYNSAHSLIRRRCGSQVQVLKKEVSDQSQQIRRQQVPPEYLKEVVVRYVLSNPVSAPCLPVQQQTTPLVAAVKAAAGRSACVSRER